MRKQIRVGIHQAEPGSPLDAAALAPYREAGVELLVLPEYFWVRRDDTSHRAAVVRFEENLRALRALSREENWLLVGGTMVEPAAGAQTGDFPEVPAAGAQDPAASAGSGRPGRRVPATGRERAGNAVPLPWHNTCVVVHRGEELARYRKINLMPRERESRAVPGASFVLIDALGLKVAPVICADVLAPETFDHVARLRADLIVAPVASPFLPEDTIRDKDRRDREIFLAGAARTGAPIVKACGVGSLFGHKLQGRSLVVTPDEILFRTPFDEESTNRSWIVDVPVNRQN